MNIITKKANLITPNVGQVKKSRLNYFKKSYQLYLMILLPLIYLIVFKYYPMYGAQIAFKKFIATKGIFGSSWVGLYNFDKFINSYQFWKLIKNTLGLSIYQLVASFPFPIFLAIALHNSRKMIFRKTVQMTTYLPHFISSVVMVGIVMQILSPRAGLVAKVVTLFGGTPVDYMGVPEYFKSIFVWTHIWQNTGWGTIIYLAALAGIDPSLHEAAIVDGASKLKRIIHIDIPGIMPTAITLLIMQAGKIMNVGFERVYLMQNPLNRESSEIISTYVYKIGIGAGSSGGFADFSYATAIGLFNSIINLILIMCVNRISKKLSETSLW